MESMEFDGQDLDDALAIAAEAVGRPVASLDYVILEGGRKGVFGLGARPVRIRVSGPAPDVPDAPLPQSAPGAAAEISAPGRALIKIIAGMGFDLTLTETRRDDTLELALDGPDRKRLIAKDGELLSALEFTLARMGRRAWPLESQVRLLCRGFRSGKDDELVELVREAAAEVSRSGRPKRLHAMNPYERRIVHVTIREFDGLTTVSEGDGFLKRVRVERIGP
jgi:spoIIIJ-associated protein